METLLWRHPRDSCYVVLCCICDAFSLHSVARAGTGAVMAVKEMPTLALPLVRKYQYALLASVAKLLQPPASPSPAKLEATGTVLAACDLVARMLVAATAALNQASTVEKGDWLSFVGCWRVTGFRSLDVGLRYCTPSDDLLRCGGSGTGSGQFAFFFHPAAGAHLHECALVCVRVPPHADCGTWQ